MSISFPGCSVAPFIPSDHEYIRKGIEKRDCRIKAAATLTKKARIPISCVVSVVGICASDDGLKISPSQNVQTPPNDKHYGYGDPCLILKFLIRFNTAALNKAAHCRQVPEALAQGERRAEDLPDCGGVDLVGISGKLRCIFFQEGVRKGEHVFF